MNIIGRISAAILGTIFVLVDINYVIGFFPTPIPSAEGRAFLESLNQTGYFIPLLKTTELVAGLMLMANIAAPLAAVILAPIVLNIFCFHFFLSPQGLLLATLMMGLEILIGWSYWNKYRAIVQPESTLVNRPNHQIKVVPKIAA